MIMSYPRYGYVNKIGKVRVLGYSGNDHWDVLDSRDQVRREPTYRINFWKENTNARNGSRKDH